MLRKSLALLFVLISASASLGVISDFDDLSLAPESYWNGSDGSGGFQSGGAWYNNNYNSSYGSWDGFAYSDITDTSSKGYAAQYNAIAGSGQGGSSNYAVGYVNTWGSSLPTLTLNTASVIDGLYVTNNNYAYYSMLEGDSYAKKFGGDTGDDPDWFLLTITGKDSSGQSTGVVNFYLADYRFSDNSQDYIVNTWQWVDTSLLGVVKSLEFSLSSSDTGQYGMNTPAYFVIDTVVPEPTTIALMIISGVFGLIRRKR